MFSQTRRIAVAGRRAGLIARLASVLTLHRQRRALLDLDDALLADIGLTRDKALAEAARPAWDVPPAWRL
ncbi:MAG: DUF1127 domain-containing protein [Paracoccaceae bacterium]